jgi:hypothetical protein
MFVLSDLFLLFIGVNSSFYRNIYLKIQNFMSETQWLIPSPLCMAGINIIYYDII